MSLLINLSVYK